MKISDRIARAASLTGASLKTLVKVALQSRPVALSPADDPTRLLIMGNGPSLRAEIDSHLSELASSTTMAVNFAANAPEFTDLKPRYYLWPTRISSAPAAMSTSIACAPGSER